MKNIYTLFLFLFFGAMFFVSCSDDDENEDTGIVNGGNSGNSGNSGSGSNSGGGTTTYEKPDVFYYDVTPARTSLKVIYKIYNNNL